MTRLRTMFPTTIRGTLHAVSGPAVVAIMAYGVATDTMAAAIVATVVAVTDLLLAMVHAETTARTLIYPALAAVAGLLMNLGVATDDQLYALLGVAAAVLGHSVAARYTPRVDLEQAPRDATPLAA